MLSIACPWINGYASERMAYVLRLGRCKCIINQGED